MSIVNPITQALEPKARQPQKGCQYNAEERAVFGKYKEEYRSKTSHQEREVLLRQNIFVDIFNYWQSQNVPLNGTDINQRAKVRYIYIE
jgi:hypothetical protein